MFRISTEGKTPEQVRAEFVAAVDQAYEERFGPQTAVDVVAGETVVVDAPAPAEERLNAGEQQRLFAPVDVMPGQTGMNL